MGRMGQGAWAGTVDGDGWRQRVGMDAMMQTGDMPAVPAKKLFDQVAHGWLMTALGLLLAGVALHDFRLGQEFEFLRVQCLVAEIVAGAGMAVCFGGAMHYLDGALGCRGAGGGRVRWYWRVVLVVQKRVLMAGQLGAAAMVVLAVGAIIFDKPIMGADRMAGLYTPPVSAPANP